MATTPVERFLSHVSPCPITGCHWWLGGGNAYGYGRFALTHQQGLSAHRAAWTFLRGPIPDGLFVLHRCDQPGCVNPAHLFLGTQADNMADKIAKGRQARREKCANKTIRRGDESWSRNHPERLARGERHGNAKLSDDDIRSIRERYRRGTPGHRSPVSIKGLGREYGVSPYVIWLIVNRHGWAHVA